MVFQVSYLFFNKSQNIRFPANNSESGPNYIFFKDSFISKVQGLYFFKTSKDGVGLTQACSSFDRVEFEFEAEEVASFTDSEGGKVGLKAKLDCLRVATTPVFYKSFCEERGAANYEDGVEFQMVNDPGFFPRSWYLKKVTLLNSAASETYAVPRELFETFSISCDL